MMGRFIVYHYSVPKGSYNPHEIVLHCIFYPMGQKANLQKQYFLMSATWVHKKSL